MVFRLNRSRRLDYATYLLCLHGVHSSDPRCRNGSDNPEEPSEKATQDKARGAIINKWFLLSASPLPLLGSSAYACVYCKIDTGPPRRINIYATNCRNSQVLECLCVD